YIAPVAEGDLQFCYHDEEEFAFVLRGRVEFRLKTPEREQLETLNRGDCIYFRSDLPHAFRSLDPEPAETLHVIASSSLAAFGNSARRPGRATAQGGHHEPADARRHAGDKLRLLREVHGWPLERVAQAAGLTERMITLIERGDRDLPVEALLKLARAFGKPL